MNKINQSGLTKKQNKLKMVQQNKLIMIHPCNCTQYYGGQCYNCLNGAHANCGKCNRKTNDKHLGVTIKIVNRAKRKQHKWPGGVSGFEWKRQMDEAFEKNDTDFLLKHQVRQVRWLYVNHNKMTMVYDEKLVRMMIQKLQNRIKELEHGVR